MSVQTTEARALLEDLVATPSVSGQEAEAAARLGTFFEDHDRDVDIDEAGNVRVPGDDAVLLTSHVDTVPGDIPVRVEDGVLWGRGSVDAKGPLCAMAVAAVETGVAFVGVVGEEDDSRGARHLVDSRAPPDALVNGEPSGWDAITLGYRGFLKGTYVGTSEAGHSSRPGNNAIQDAIEWWTRVEAEFEADDWTPVFERVTAKPVAVEGGPSTDGLSVEASMDVQLRVPPGMELSEVREVVDGELTTGTVRWKDAIPPTMQDPRTVVGRAFRAEIRGAGAAPRQLRKTGTSDMNIYAAAWDCPMLTYGPGDSSLDHTPEERLDFEEFDRSITVLTGVCERLKA